MAGINENSDEWLDELLTKFPFHPEPLELSGKQHTVSPRLPYPELFVAVRRMLEHKTRTGHNVLMHD